MARCPFAEWRPLPEDRTQPVRVGTPAIIDHSIVGSAEGAYGYFLRSTSLESHFIVKHNGDIIQLIDTARTADANLGANRYAVSIETEDHGDPDRNPWTSAQLASLIRLHAWIADTHDVPRRQCRTTSDAGLGYHTLFGAPSAWTPVAKTCPGHIRIKQWEQVLLPAFIRGTAPTLDLEETMFCKQGDKDSEVVRYWQRFLRNLGQSDLKVDGDYGPAVKAAVHAVTGYKGDEIASLQKLVLELKLFSGAGLSQAQAKAQIDAALDSLAIVRK